MEDLFSPKQVANAINVSESSVKRWCDRGQIPTQYTAGGHRRIPIAGLIQFLRSQNCDIVNPELLGLPANTGPSAESCDQATDSFCTALVSGAEEEARRIIFGLYFAEHSLSRICDEVIAPAFQEIGRLWECGDADVYEERLGCEMTLHLLHELRRLLPRPSSDAPVAIGGAPEGDQYCLATTMVELTLRDAGWNATSLGDNLPLSTLGKAIEANRPQLFWLSCSHLSDEKQFLDNYARLFDRFGSEVAFAVGGRALVESQRRKMKYAAYCDNLQHLETFAQTLQHQTSK